jgi:transcription antitermination protein NusB
VSRGDDSASPMERMQERTRARLQALQILYQSDITGASVSSILESGSYSVQDGEPSEFCRSLVLGVEENIEEVDGAVESTSKHWTVSRMPIVDRNILRLATYEILHCDSIPVSVSINEAVEMAKIYGGEDSSRFVNGVLGRIAETGGEDDDDLEFEDGELDG